MKTCKILNLPALISCCVLLLGFSKTGSNEPDLHDHDHIALCGTPKGCVFKTVFGEESSDSSFIYNTPQNVVNSIESGLRWIATAQQNNGGWGAGSHSMQHIKDPHAVNTDPATTAMVGMALLRTGNRLNSGTYSKQLNNALHYLIDAVESTPKNQLKITTETNTQIQSKLGENIDAVLTLQFFSNMMDHLDDHSDLKNRVKNCMDICADKIQKLQDHDGSLKGSGWAGVLQSALANNALESAQYNGAKVDDDVLKRSRKYQKDNYDTRSGKVNTSKGAGIVLYSVSGSVRASAKEARQVKEAMRKAKAEGKLGKNAKVSSENLIEIGFSEDEALDYTTAYEIYESSKNKAQDDQVMRGFGNNGGEEFLSYMQTGESLIINKDEGWKTWYDNISGRLIKIQNNDGSWNGHHCITSPVFCTATTLLTLSINNDIDKLIALGEK
ncbi:hypothetical protein QQ008_14010 [Fulvivirgaceae bacterium BMA10]|uniref:Squalene cyclase C-terminal domain-containing protein n=1 Tax=Splendidivirga corallicola TaxID=3051826 RepID=A0ABT8KP15_9BACT|nr:hypothetical protein [Fulvivirgaceae bacterium BMA10]